MAKKKTAAKRKRKQQQLPENALPQNILPVGERVEEDKNIYLSQKVYKEIHNFTKNKLTNESGGVLVGTVIEEFGKTNILVSGFIEAKYCEATPTTLKFTHESWEYIHKEIEKKHPGKKIMGWIHTHPDFGIFLSEYDKFIHENFFNEQNQIAYVVDPIQNIEGFYFWIHGKIEKCKGFYIFDKTGAKIDVNPDKEPQTAAGGAGGKFSVQNILIAILAVAVVFLIFSNASLNSEVERLQTQQEAIVTSANQSLAYLQQQIGLLNSEVAALREALQSAPEEVQPDTPSGDAVGTEDTGSTETTTEAEDTGSTEAAAETEETNGNP